MKKKAAFALAAAVVVGVTSLAAPSPAEARWRGGGWGWGPGIAGGLIGAAVIGGLASSAYAYGPGYGYYGGLAPGGFRHDYSPPVFWLPPPHFFGGTPHKHIPRPFFAPRFPVP